MEGRTHFASGLLLWTLGWGPASLLGALFPDIDIKNSVMGSRVVSLGYKHRGLFHSFPFMVILGGTAYLGGFGGFLIGYGVHLGLDATTRKGIAPFQPFSKKRWRGPIETGDFFDFLTSALFFAAATATIF